MPFDGTAATETRPGLQALADILRDRSRWPEGFVWDYRDPDRCGLGLARSVWGAEVSGACQEAARRPFFCVAEDNHCWMHQVTPEMVADSIEDCIQAGAPAFYEPAPGFWRRLFRALVR